MIEEYTKTALITINALLSEVTFPWINFESKIADLIPKPPFATWLPLQDNKEYTKILKQAQKEINKYYLKLNSLEVYLDCSTEIGIIQRSILNTLKRLVEQSKKHINKLTDNYIINLANKDSMNDIETFLSLISNEIYTEKFKEFTYKVKNMKIILGKTYKMLEVNKYNLYDLDFGELPNMLEGNIMATVFKRSGKVNFTTKYICTTSNYDDGDLRSLDFLPINNQDGSPYTFKKDRTTINLCKYDMSNEDSSYVTIMTIEDEYCLVYIGMPYLIYSMVESKLRALDFSYHQDTSRKELNNLEIVQEIKKSNSTAITKCKLEQYMDSRMQSKYEYFDRTWINKENDNYFIIYFGVTLTQWDNDSNEIGIKLTNPQGHTYDHLFKKEDTVVELLLSSNEYIFLHIHDNEKEIYTLTDYDNLEYAIDSLDDI